MSRLSVSNLRKKYRSRVVVKDVSFDVQGGEVVGLLGPNGAGKTTCFYMIVGLVAADAGRIVLDGTDIDRKSTRLNSSHLKLSRMPSSA